MKTALILFVSANVVFVYFKHYFLRKQIVINPPDKYDFRQV